MLYVQDRMNHTLAVLENYYNDTHTLILESGVSTYNFTISKNQDGSEYLVRGNYVVLADDKGQGWKFTIMATDETHSSLDVECEDLGLELLNKVRNSWASPGSAQPFKFYFDKVVRDTGWTLGVNEISNLSRTLSWDGRDTALKRLLSICTQFDHAEIEFKVEFKNMQVTKQVVNVYKQRGANRSDVQLVYGDTVNDIRKTTEIRELATAIQGVGGVIQKDNPVEGEPEEHVDFSSLTYDDGEYFTPAGDPFLYARVANQQFNIKDTYLEDFYDYDTQDAQELLNRTLTQLKDRCQPKINYEVDLAKVDSSLNLGDTVTIIDHDYKPELLLSGRVLQLEKSYTDSSKNKATFGNFLILYSNISDQLRALQEQMNSLKPVANYMWLRYAKDDKGNGMTAMPTSDTKYVAIISNKSTGVPSDDPADYAGHWQLIQGQDGTDAVVLNVSSVNGNMFKNTGISTILTVSISVGDSIFDTAEKMHAVFGADAYLQWQVKNAGELEFKDVSLTDTRLSDGGFLFAVSAADVNNKSTFKCELYY
ncbi:phage tail spike protein [Latilactobacillus curvatus]